MHRLFALGLLVTLPELNVVDYAPFEVRVACSELPGTTIDEEVMVNGPMYFRDQYVVESVQEGILVLRRSTSSKHGVGEP
jgi:hypothetical protein